MREIGIPRGAGKNFINTHQRNMSKYCIHTSGNDAIKRLKGKDIGNYIYDFRFWKQCKKQHIH